MIRSARGREWAGVPFLIATVLMLPASVMAVLASGSNTLPGDVAVARAVQGIGLPGAALLAQLGYILGGTIAAVTLALAVAFVLYVRNLALPSLMMAVMPLLFLVNSGIKWVVASPRPTADQVRVTEDASFYGFPSGHVMTAVLVYGAMFFLAPVVSDNKLVQTVIRAVAIGAIVVTSFSRVYSGAHWPSDVGGGYLWGSIVLLLAISAYSMVSRSWRRRLPANLKRPAPLGNEAQELAGRHAELT